MSSVNFLAEYGLKKISKCGQVVAYTEIKKKKNDGNGCLWLVVVFPSTEKSQESTSMDTYVF